ncbi:MAG: deoxyribonuclease IV [Gemmatimonadetes bacterium]|nr:deoxyribonuclease IV [Gemmatimonadota bacterium]
MLLGAHVSTAGGMRNAIVRAAEIDATAIQIFTKQPNRWADPPLDPADVESFRVGRLRGDIGFACAHDSYLINLATPDPILRDRSYASFQAELARAGALGLDAIVSHPGNATDGDHARGRAQNAALVESALKESDGSVKVLLETTAGAGSVLGSRFEELAEMIELVSSTWRDHVGVCVDTCHVWAAGYDIRDGYEAVVEEFARILGLDRLQLFHLNDSQKPLASKRDRHAWIGDGTLGDEPFRSIMRDPRFAAVPRVIETPKGDDHAATDRMNLERLRRLREG